MSKQSWLFLLLMCSVSINVAWATGETDKQHKSGKPAHPAQLTHPNPLPAPEAMLPFDFSKLEQYAKALAGQAFTRDEGGMPEFLGTLNYDQYRDIRYKLEKGLWRDEGLPYQIQFFHRGFTYKDRVNVNIVDQGKVTRVEYSPEMFDFGKNALPSPLPEQMDKSMGFAGIRLRHPLRHDDVYDEIAVFLGASYFRAVGLGQTYGISARGLAIDTGLPRAEEFPVFKEFWIEKPTKNATSLSFYALLDSPSLTGAYHFVIQPGLDLSTEVTARIYFRKEVERLGVAPLTSMYFHGENTDRFIDDFRPEVHDSDGLLMNRSNGEWVWRPLNNPRQLRISVFHEDKPQGYGLMKRDRNYDHYHDMEAHYHERPSAWIEPLGDWGPGALYLIEIPSDAEKYDNIVAYWTPDQPMGKGKGKDKVKGEFAFKYRLHFLLNESMGSGKARVESTRIGAGGTADLDSANRKFVVDFNGDALKLFSDKAPVEAEISASSGRINDHPVVHKNNETGSWRLSFELTPEKDNKDPIELRAHLKSSGEILTETWIYQWSGR